MFPDVKINFKKKEYSAVEFKDAITKAISSDYY